MSEYWPKTSFGYLPIISISSHVGGIVACFILFLFSIQNNNEGQDALIVAEY